MKMTGDDIRKAFFDEIGFIKAGERIPDHLVVSGDLD